MELQMDKASSANQIFLWNLRECVPTQIWISVSAFLLLTIAKRLIHIEELSLYIISQNIGIMLFKKIPISELFNKPIKNVPKNDGQLDLFQDLKSSRNSSDVSLQVPHVHQPCISPVRERHKEFIRELQQAIHLRFI